MKLNSIIEILKKKFEFLKFKEMDPIRLEIAVHGSNLRVSSNLQMALFDLAKLP